MAEYTKEKTKTKNTEYSTSVVGMMADAKEYAKKDFYIIVNTMKEYMGDAYTPEMEADIANTHLMVKYAQIVESRTKRTSYFD
ncbi:MAG: hypothetical protein GQ570_08535 [Helicobacteraceae bacterium]|nr:hypothetical protein [Helicobacteraceae bacterium]